MKSRFALVCLAAGALAGAGCGDTPRSVLRQALSLQNEMADGLTRVSDNESAEAFEKNKLEKLKKRWENLEGTARRVFGELSTKEKHAAARVAFGMLDEMLETELRVRDQKDRLEGLRFLDFAQENTVRSENGIDVISMDEKVFTIMEKKAKLLRKHASAIAGTIKSEMAKRTNERKPFDVELVFVNNPSGELSGKYPAFVDTALYKEYQSGKVALDDVLCIPKLVKEPNKAPKKWSAIEARQALIRLGHKAVYIDSTERAVDAKQTIDTASSYPKIRKLISSCSNLNLWMIWEGNPFLGGAGFSRGGGRGAE